MLIASGIGVGLSKGIYAAIGLDLPNYLMAFLTAIVMFLVFRKVGVGNYIDENVVGRISVLRRIIWCFSESLPSNWQLSLNMQLRWHFFCSAVL